MIERRCTFCGDYESSEVQAVWLQAPKEHTGVFDVYICEGCVLKSAQRIQQHYREMENAAV